MRIYSVEEIKSESDNGLVQMYCTLADYVEETNEKSDNIKNCMELISCEMKQRGLC